MIYLTADLHFGHKNVIKYSNRPFKHVDEMDEKIIENWNSLIKTEDKVYVLGDISFYSKSKTENILRRLKGELFWINGNHDGHSDVTKYDRFLWRKDYYELCVQKKEAYGGREVSILFHYPIEHWNGKHYGVPHFHGHSHGGLGKNYKIRRIDVGIDCNNMFPFSYEQLMKELEKYEMPTRDHHGRDL